MAEAPKTLRDEMAMAALSGLLAATTSENIMADHRRGLDTAALTADAAYRFADAMLKARLRLLGTDQ
jgi:hypothetical protein